MKFPCREISFLKTLMGFKEPKVRRRIEMRVRRLIVSNGPSGEANIWVFGKR